jgi:hypothetical protein
VHDIPGKARKNPHKIKTKKEARKIKQGTPDYCNACTGCSQMKTPCPNFQDFLNIRMELN